MLPTRSGTMQRVKGFKKSMALFPEAVGGRKDRFSSSQVERADSDSGAQ